MRKKLAKDLTATTAQVVLNQVLGLLVFYITSRYLIKEVYGELNWSIALISTVVIILGLGLEQIIVRRIAADRDGISASRIFIFYSIVSSFLFIAMLLTLRFVLGSFFSRHFLIIGISVSSIISYLSSPFKQIVYGKEKFNSLAILTVLSNLVKATLMVLVVVFWQLTINWVIGIYVLSSLAELVAGILIINKMNLPVWPTWNNAKFKSLVRESLPQLGVIIFDSALARIDWILLGFMVGAVATAEYSFAYKIFEVSRLPMLIIAPIILTKFSRYFALELQSDQKKKDLELLLRLEIAVAFIIPIIFNVVWTPFFEILTDDKYGAANKNIYLILSFAVPLHTITNFLWTMAFSKQQLKQTFIITMITAGVNIFLNILLIPAFRATGAAVAFTASTIVQVYLYKQLINEVRLKSFLYPLTLCLLIASAIVYILILCSFNILVNGLVGVFSYVILLFLFKIVTRNDIISIRLLLQK